MITFNAAEFMTLTNVEMNEGRFRTREFRTYMLDDKRKAVVTIDIAQGKNIGWERVTVDAYVNDPHEYIWYDCYGEEQVEQCEWRRVFTDRRDGINYDMLLAQAYGMLVTISW